jgi:glutaredoxin-like YruB-family protein
MTTNFIIAFWQIIVYKSFEGKMGKKKVKKKAKKQIKKSKVIVYSTPTCPWCRTAKEFLKKHNVSFKDYDVSTDEKAREEMIKKSDQIGVPVLDINGTIIVGFDVDKIKEALKHG